MSNAKWPSHGALIWTSISVLCGFACEAEPTNVYNRGAAPFVPPPAGGGGADAGTTGGGADAGGTGGGGTDAGGTMTCVVEGVVACAGGPVPDACNTKADAALGSISGEVVVAAGTMPGAGRAAMGDLYLLAMPSFDKAACPDDKNPTLPAAMTVIHCADLRKGDKVAFRIEGVPPRPKAWHIVPYLDVNVSTTPGATALDACDVLALATETVVATATEVKLAAPIKLDLTGATLVDRCKLPACK